MVGRTHGFPKTPAPGAPRTGPETAEYRRATTRPAGKYGFVGYIGSMARVSTANWVLRRVVLALSMAAGAAHPCFGQTPSFTLVGVAPGAEASNVNGLSTDGRAAAGYSLFPTSSNTRYPGFVWRAGEGRTDFGLQVAPTVTFGQGISGDGATVVGGSQPSQTGVRTAFRWSAIGGYQDLGTLPGYAYSEARKASNDASVIVGNCSTGPFGQGYPHQAFRWTATGGMYGLGADTTALGLSRDGSTIVGNAGVGFTTAFTWTASGGMRYLPSLGGTGSSMAGGANFDGSIITGASGEFLLPTIWRNGVPYDFWNGSTPAFRFAPSEVDDAGDVAAGFANSSIADFAAVWTQSRGIEPLADYLTANGVLIPAGVSLFTCTGLSGDGRTFAGITTGVAIGAQGFVATIPAPGPVSILALALPWASRRRR